MRTTHGHFALAEAQHASFSSSSNDDHCVRRVRRVRRSCSPSDGFPLRESPARHNCRGVVRSLRDAGLRMTKSETRSQRKAIVTPQWQVLRQSVTRSALRVCPYFCRQYGTQVEATRRQSLPAIARYPELSDRHLRICKPAVPSAPVFRQIKEGDSRGLSR